MNEIILSIHPRFCQQILNGTKTVEMRRSWAKNKVDKVYLYETSPTSMLVGECEVKAVYLNTPTEGFVDNIPEGFDPCHGIGDVSEDEFFEYCEGGRVYFIHLKNVFKYGQALPLAEFGVPKAPQNFCYIRPNKIGLFV